MAAALVTPLLAEPRGCRDPTGRAGGGALDGTRSPGEGRLRGAAPSRYLLVPAQCGRLPAGMPRGMTPLRGERARTPRRPLRRAPRPDRGRAGRDGAVSSRTMSPDGQSKPLAERAASPSQCAHLAERRGEGRELLHFWGRYQPPRPSPAPRSPPPAPPTPAGSRQQRRSPGPPPRPAPHPLRCPLCPALPRSAPHLPRTSRQPLPHGETKEVLNRIFLLVPPYFSFLCPPKHAAPSEARAAWVAVPAQGTQLCVATRARGARAQLSVTIPGISELQKRRSKGRRPHLGPASGWHRIGTAPAPPGRGGTGTRGMLRAQLSVPTS